MNDNCYLLGDIGGTHTRLAVLTASGITDIQVFNNRIFGSLTELIRRYALSLPALHQPSRAVLAVAGPVIEDPRSGHQAVFMTNLGWQIEADQLAVGMGYHTVTLINDFSALALSLPYLNAVDLCPIGQGQAISGAAMAVIGPGTGLGISGLLPINQQWVAVQGEGGHATLAASNEAEFALLNRLRQRFGHVSAERIISGSGLSLLYEVLTAEHGQPQHLPPEEISKRAIAGSDAQAQQALALFFGFLGSVAGNLALTLGARGGVFLAGGILPQMIAALEASSFRQRFEDKGRYRNYLATIPCYVIINPQVVFRGLRSLAEVQ